MVSKISDGVKVSVETFYQGEHSSPVDNDFMFTYRITIENKNTFPVQLLRRHWYIFDSLAANCEVEGEGVVGVQPVINPLGKYQYTSGCHLRSEIGKMHGFYSMENCHNKTTFLINVPAFELFAPSKLN